MKNRFLLIALTLIMMVAFMPVLPGLEFGKVNAAGETYTGTWPSWPTAGETIAGEARRLALPYGANNTYDHDKYAVITKYDSGKPTDEFKAAFDKVYPEHWTWGSTTYGYATRVGASCDVFTGTVIRSCGYDKNMPRGLEKDTTYLPGKTDLWKQVSYPTSTAMSGMQPGDVLFYYKNSGSGHIYIYVGDGRLCDAALAKRYGAERAVPSSYITVSADMKMAFRPIGKGRSYWQRGDKSTQVKHIQNFLNWAGFNCGTADGSFGANTEKAVKQFQAAVGIKADGQFGSGTLEKAKTYVRGTSVANTAVKTTAPASASKKAYTGKYPTKSISYHKGTKTNIKYWQAYLKWYGYSIKIDGGFGKSTRDITKKFQKANGLKVDGKVGPKTIAKAKTIKK